MPLSGHTNSQVFFFFLKKKEMNYEAYFLSLLLSVCVYAYKRQGRLSFFLGLCLFFFGKRSRKTTVISCPVGKTGKRQRKRFFSLFLPFPIIFFGSNLPRIYVLSEKQTNTRFSFFTYLCLRFFVDWSYHVCP